MSCCSHEFHTENCGCQGGGMSHRRMLTRDEKKQILKDYAEQLKKELEGVEERLKEME